MRLFVALELPKEAVSAISRIQTKLRQEIAADRWQPLGNLHLTLHFLGDVEEELIPKLCADLDMVGSIIETFSLILGGFGVFPRPDKPRVLWLGLNGQRRSLEQLHLLLGKRFDLHPGLQYDRRPYHPHITLARGPQGKDLPLSDWNERFLETPAVRWTVDAVHLYRSDLLPTGACHTILHTCALRQPVLPGQR